MFVHIVKKKVPFLLLAVLILLPAAYAQDGEYNEAQYKEYTTAVGLEDPAERAEAILSFVTANPKVSLVKYAVAKYVEVMQQFQQQGDNQKVLELGEQLLAIDPEDVNALYLSGFSAFQLNDYAKAAKYSEAAYAKNPNPGLLYILAISFQNLKDQAKFIEYGERVLEGLEPASYLPGHLQILAGLRGATAGGNMAKAADYSKQMIAALDGAPIPAGTSERDWKRYVNSEKAISYALLGQRAVKQENWSEAISHYQRVAQFTTDKNLKAEAYYFIGRGRWQQNRLDPAMEAFAMGSVIKGAQNADACRDLLERLYKSTHNGSTAGLDEFIVENTVK